VGNVGDPLSVAITGLDSYWGLQLAERLLASDSGVRIVGLDLRRPMRLEGRIDFHRVDLTDPGADSRIAEILVGAGVEAVVHLAFRSTSRPSSRRAPELETVGGQHVMNACAAAKIRRLVVLSSTMLYGPRADNPNFLSESHPLRGHPDAEGVTRRVELEAMLADWIPRHPDTEVTVLRCCWALGPRYSDHVARFFEHAVVPTALGYDPLLQFVHEDDLLDVLEQATTASHPGTFNIVGRGVLPLSTLLALAGRRRLPLPLRLLHRGADPLVRGRTGDRPAGFYDYLRFLWVADGERGWAEFGEPAYSTREAWVSFVSSRRLQAHR
jgi:UDP-glucose 4-epimerase